MKAMVIRQFGAADSFVLDQLPRPDLRPGHVLIRVRASSVNPIDVKVRSGVVPAITPAFPAILHGDVAGIVEAVGLGVDGFYNSACFPGEAGKGLSLQRARGFNGFSDFERNHFGSFGSCGCLGRIGGGKNDPH